MTFLLFNILHIDGFACPSLVIRKVKFRHDTGHAVYCDQSAARLTYCDSNDLPAEDVFFSNRLIEE
jgi:hypothetical protein